MWVENLFYQMNTSLYDVENSLGLFLERKSLKGVFQILLCSLFVGFLLFAVITTFCMFGIVVEE